MRLQLIEFVSFIALSEPDSDIDFDIPRPQLSNTCKPH